MLVDGRQACDMIVSQEWSGLEGRLPLPSCENFIKLPNYFAFCFHISKQNIPIAGANKHPWKHYEINNLVFNEKQIYISSHLVREKSQKKEASLIPMFIN